MGKWLAAIAKKLSSIIRSFGPIGELALNFDNDEKVKQSDTKLQELIISSRA